MRGKRLEARGWRLEEARSQLLVLWIAIALVVTPSALCQGPTPIPSPVPSPTLSKEGIERQRADLAQEIAEFQSSLNEPTAQANVSRLQSSVDLCGKTDLAYERQIAELRRQEDLKRQKDDIDRDLFALRAAGPDDKSPLTFALLDSTLDELHEEILRQNNVDIALETAEQNLAQSEATLEEKEQARKQTMDQVQLEGTQVSDLALTLKTYELECRLAKAMVDLHRLESENETRLGQIHGQRVALLSEKVEKLSLGARFTQKDLDERIKDLDQREDDVRKALNQAKLDLANHEEKHLAAQGRAGASAGLDPTLVEEVETWRLGLETYGKEVDVLARELDRLSGMKESWRRRFLALQKAEKRDVLSEWEKEARRSLDQLQQEQSLLVMRLSEYGKDLAAMTRRATQVPPPSAEVARWISEQQKRLQKLNATLEADMVSIDQAQRLEEKLLSDLQSSLGSVTLWDHVSILWAKVLVVWRFEISKVDDKPITVSKVVTGLMLFFLSFWLSRRLSNWMGNRLLPRLGANESAAVALKTLAFYAFLLTFTLSALRLVNVPLTVFTILGSAVAIGVGFGSQTILGNFISGLILLVERPIRIGDVIQIQGFDGRVTHIGARSTRLLTPLDSEIIVPNSAFLENSVVNWTLGDPRIKTFVRVGVAYGTPSERVTALLLQAACEIPGIFQNPGPVVLFTDFGDNALMFEIHFGIQMKNHIERRIVESDLRHRIDKMLREAGIVISYPQRDVHLDAIAPLRIQLMSPPDPKHHHPEP